MEKNEIIRRLNWELEGTPFKVGYYESSVMDFSYPSGLYVESSEGKSVSPELLEKYLNNSEKDFSPLLEAVSQKVGFLTAPASYLSMEDAERVLASPEMSAGLTASDARIASYETEAAENAVSALAETLDPSVLEGLSGSVAEKDDQLAENFSPSAAHAVVESGPGPVAAR